MFKYAAPSGNTNHFIWLIIALALCLISEGVDAEEMQKVSCTKLESYGFT